MSLEGNVEAVEPENSTHEETETLDFEGEVAKLLAEQEPTDPQPELEKGNQEPQEPEEEEEDPTVPESEPEAEDDDDELSFLEEEEEDREKKAPDISKGVQKRIDKLTAQKYALEEENQELKDQVKQLESQPRAQAQKPGLQFTSEEDIDKQEMTLNSYVDFAEQSLAEWSDDPERVEGTLDKVVPDWKSQTDDAERFLKTVLLNSNRALRQLPKQREYVRQVETERASAEKEFPWLTDPSNKRTQWVEAQKRKFPELQAIPGVDKYLGYALAGMAAERKKGGKVVRKAEPTPQPKVTSRAKPHTDRLKAASENVMKRRDRSSLAEWIAADLELQQT